MASIEVLVYAVVHTSLQQVQLTGLTCHTDFLGVAKLMVKSDTCQDTETLL